MSKAKYEGYSEDTPSKFVREKFGNTNVYSQNAKSGSDPKVVVSEMLLSNNFEDYFRKSKVNKFLCQSEAETLIVS